MGKAIQDNMMISNFESVMRKGYIDCGLLLIGEKKNEGIS